MEARKLKKLLNNTGYAVHYSDGKVCVGSPLCSDLFSVNAETMKVKYALDTWNEGRKCFEETSRKSENSEGLFIWDKLHELIESGELQKIIENDDTIENKLPVFTCEDGVLVESFTDAYGWPNVTISGELMYDNTWYKTKKEALEQGIESMGYRIEWNEERIERLTKEIKERTIEQLELKEKLNNLTTLSTNL